MHRIRHASLSDVGDIISFIANNWRSDHIFVRDPEFFAYEMCEGSRCNFALAFDESRLIGILGYVQSGRELGDSDLFLVMFRVLKGGAVTVGAELVGFVRGLTNRGVHSLGVNPTVLPYYKFLGFRSGWMDHYCWVNESTEYRSSRFLVESPRRPRTLPHMPTLSGWCHAPADSEEATVALSSMSDRRHLRFQKRYSSHPLFRYQFCFNAEGCCGVYREVDVDGIRCARIVDWTGPFNKFPKFARSLISKASDEGFGFVDCYSAGLAYQTLFDAGLTRVSDRQFLIPNHLCPLVWENIALSYVTTSRRLPLFMRGDGDQDRPS